MRTYPRPISHTRFRREDGFGLIEVLVSVLLLSVIALGVLAMIDGPTAVSGASKARSTAAALAQQDQDRMRAMTATDLARYNTTRSVPVQGVSYIVKSRASWVSDASGTESCTSNSNEANYLRISSTVTWPSIATAKPVQAASLMSPPASLGATAGSLAMQVTDQAGFPVTGVTVRTAPGNLSEDTNSAGCAFFGAMAAGNYSATFSRPGWVNTAGVADVTLAGSVMAGSTTTLSQTFAPAAQVVASFDTRIGTSAPQAARAGAITIVNPGLPAPGFRSFTATGPQLTISATNVYPFTSGYGVYAGTCAAANPVQYNPNYYAQHPMSYATPGPNASANVTVRQPALNVRVRRSGAALANAHVVVRATGSGCTETYTMTTDSAGTLVLGAAPYTAPAVPFGTYSVCADDTRRRFTANVSNTQANGNQGGLTTITVPTSGGLSVCT